MDATTLPLLLEPEQLFAVVADPQLIVFDVCKQEHYSQAHILGAVHVAYERLVEPRPPVLGFVPDFARLVELFQSLGLQPSTHVVAYDDEGGGRATRLLWTLDLIGHTRYSLLNGGLAAWVSAGYPTSDVSPQLRPATKFDATFNETPIASRDYILSQLNSSATLLLDVRSPGEYQGSIKRAARGGHIPGAVNMEWTQFTTAQHKIKPLTDIRQQLHQAGITADKEIITYCHSHHRSAHTYFVLKLLGFPKLKAYPGSWSDWGNNSDVPIE